MIIEHSTIFSSSLNVTLEWQEQWIYSFTQALLKYGNGG
jgi:hypothetical protein